MIQLVLASVALGALLILVFASVSSLWQSHESCELIGRSSFDGEPWWERAIISRRMSIDAGLCRVCSKATTTQCSRCKSVKYCSISCQRKDWMSNHKFECDNLQKLAALAATSPAAAAAQPSKPPPPDPNEDAPVPRQVLFPYQHYLQLCHNRNSCRRPPVGLTNLGNNCYANAALQCLLANKPLRAYLDQGLHTSSCNKPHRNEWCLLCELQVLCKRMAEASPGDEVSVRPLLRHLRRFAKTLSYGRQEDAHEFFYSLLNTMEAIQLTNYGGKERFDMRSQETTLVHHVFGSYLRSQVVCGGCGAASRRYEVALDLQLEVPPGVDRLEDALARHTAEEVLDGDNRYACDACKQRCRATRSTRFEVAPNSLVLCLKRFGTGRFGKINKMLGYGEHLDLRPFMAAGAMDGGEVTYSLAGVVVHLDQMNSTSFGHYICFVRTADGRWYGCDDARVAATSLSRVMAQNAYMLFYQRDTPKPAPQPGYKRLKPLSPAAAPAAVAVSAAAAAASKQQPQVVVANGTAAAAAAESDTQQQQQLDQQPPALQRQEQQQQQQQQLNTEAAQVQPEQEQQQQQREEAVSPPLATEHLARVSTAPAALVRMADESGSSTSRDEEDASVTSSSYLADADGSECCSTPSDAAQQAAAGAVGAAPWHASHRSSLSSSSIGVAAAGSEQAAAGPQLGSEGGGKQDQQQQQQWQQAGVVEQQGSGAAAADDSSSSGGLPQIVYKITRSGPELLQLRAHLPGVSSAAGVAVDVLNAGPQLQRLQLKVPGQFALLDVPLSSHLMGAGAAAEGDAVRAQAVRSVSAKLYRRRQTLSLKLHLVDVDVGSMQQQVQGDGALGAGGSSGSVCGVVHWHSTDGCESSSGSESDGLVVPMSSMRSVMSEMDLSSFFGRHTGQQGPSSSSSRAQEAMQELRSQGQQQQQPDGAGDAAWAQAGSNGTSTAAGSSKKGVGKKGGGKKGGKGKKRK